VIRDGHGNRQDLDRAERCYRFLQDNRLPGLIPARVQQRVVAGDFQFAPQEAPGLFPEPAAGAVAEVVQG